MAIYLDHNATTPLEKRALEVMLPWLQEVHGNASSVHSFGRKARAAIETAREQVAELVNAHPSQIIFTSGGTEANNLAIKGIVARYPAAHIAVSAIEHASLLDTAYSCCKYGWRVTPLPVNQQGQVVINTDTLQTNTRLVSVMWANNETGIIQNIAAIATMAAMKNAIFHTDASQAVGKIPVDFAASRAQLMTISAHKFAGPQGIGALVTDKTQELEPLLHGGGQEKGLRSGTENVAFIVGFGAAAALARQELTQRMIHLQTLRQRLETGLRELVGVKIVAEQVARLPNTVMITVAGFTGESLVMGLDRCGIAVSSGSACHSKLTEPSHVLLAMGLSAQQARSAIRISVGMQNSAADIDNLLIALKKQIKDMQALALAVGIT